LATDGLGVGSFEYGRLRENVLSASVVLPGGERYFPIRPSFLPGGFPGLSREFTSVAELSQKSEQVEDRAPSVALQGNIARSGEILLLAIGDVVS
jgi:FAD/FMN-containing dehydrogenase